MVTAVVARVRAAAGLMPDPSAANNPPRLKSRPPDRLAMRSD